MPDFVVLQDAAIVQLNNLAIFEKPVCAKDILFFNPIKLYHI